MPVSESVMRFFAYFAICAFGTIILVIALVTYQSQGLGTTAINIGLAFFVLLDIVFFVALVAALKGWIGGKSQIEES
jgi:bacteriorhodopsin